MRVASAAGFPVAETAGAARLHRDRVTWLVYLQLGVYGYVLYALGPAVQLLREETGVSKTVSGLHGTAMALGALTTGLVGARIVGRIGRPAALWMGVAGTCAAAALLTVSRAVAVTLTAAYLAIMFGAYVVNSVSTVMADHHGSAGPTAVAEAHGTAALVGLLAPLALGVAQSTGAGWRVGVLACIPVALMVVLVFRGVAPQDHRASLVDHDVAGRRLSGRYWWAWAVIVTCVAVEFSFTLWASVLLRERVGLSKGAAAAGVTAVVAGMAVGRFVAARLARSVSLDRLLHSAIAVTAVGWLIFWIATDPVLAYTGLAVAGLGIAFHFPLGAMRAIGAAPGLMDRASARVSIGVGFAIGTGPFALGALADAVGTHRAFLVVPALLVAAALAVWLSRPPAA